MNERKNYKLNVREAELTHVNKPFKHYFKEFMLDVVWHTRRLRWRNEKLNKDLEQERKAIKVQRQNHAQELRKLETKLRELKKKKVNEC